MLRSSSKTLTLRRVIRGPRRARPSGTATQSCVCSRPACCWTGARDDGAPAQMVYGDLGVVTHGRAPAQRLSSRSIGRASLSLWPAARCRVRSTPAPRRRVPALRKSSAAHGYAPAVSTATEHPQPEVDPAEHLQPTARGATAVGGKQCGLRRLAVVSRRLRRLQVSLGGRYQRARTIRQHQSQIELAVSAQLAEHFQRLPLKCMARTNDGYLLGISREVLFAVCRVILR